MDKILDGSKKYEIRGQPCHDKVGKRILLAASGTGQIFGHAKVVKVHGPLSVSDWKSMRPGHQVQGDALPYRRGTYAWELDEVVPLSAPITFARQRGTVIWQNLPKNKISLDL